MIRSELEFEGVGGWRESNNREMLGFFNMSRSNYRAVGE
jgi:hypothetical protein